MLFKTIKLLLNFIKLQRGTNQKIELVKFSSSYSFKDIFFSFQRGIVLSIYEFL